MIFFMASKHNNGNNTSGPKQSLSREVKDLASKKPLDFITFEFYERYSPQIHSQSTPGPTYTSSPETASLHQDYSLNKELLGVTLEDPLYVIPNTKVDQLRHHTLAYLKSIDVIPIIYQIPRSCASQKMTQPFGEDKTLKPSIDDLIIDRISEIQQSIATIAQSETQEDLEFHNFLYFPKGDSSFYNFPEAQADGSGPL
jgi:hypothetical protein